MWRLCRFRRPWAPRRFLNYLFGGYPTYFPVNFRSLANYHFFREFSIFEGNEWKRKKVSHLNIPKEISLPARWRQITAVKLLTVTQSNLSGWNVTQLSFKDLPLFGVQAWSQRLVTFDWWQIVITRKVVGIRGVSIFFCYLWNSSQTESMILICLRWCLRDPGLAPVDMKRRREELYRHDIDLPPSLSICPVCGTSVSKENIGIHVEEHFTQPSTSSEANRFDDLGEMSIFEARFSIVKSILKASSRYVGSKYNKVCFCLISVPGFSDTVDFRECNYGRCQQIG